MFANLPNRRFGVEIEFVGLNPTRAAQILSENGFPCQYENYNHSTRAHWKIVHDGSIEYRNDNCGELVSPPLQGVAGLEEVRKVLRIFAANGATVNASCGLHVHVEAAGLTIPQIRKVVTRYQAFQSDINNFMPVSRRGSRWAKPIDDYFLNFLNRYETIPSLRSNCPDFDRYYAVNIAAFGRHGTLEFRQHSASVNASKVARWIAFCLFFVETSAQMVSTTVSATRTRGRPINYAARRTILQLLTRPEGATLEQLSERSGMRMSTISTSIFGQLRGMGYVNHSLGNYTFVPNYSSPNTASVLESWIGVAPIGSPPATASMPDSEDSLFRNMPEALASFYRDRAANFAS